jgi:RimJ/RimL family protein N-acetyltransferase
VTVDFPPSIETARLLLRPLRDTDADALWEAVEESRAELERWIRWPTRVGAVDDVPRMIAAARAASAAGESRELGLFRRDGRHLIGGSNLRVLNGDVPSFALAYWLRTAAVGNGYMREAVRALTGVALGRMCARRVVIACDPGNRRSARVAEACGYSFEARLRNEIVSPAGEVRDVLIYAMIDTDPAARALVNDSAPNTDDPETEEMRS